MSHVAANHHGIGYFRTIISSILGTFALRRLQQHHPVYSVWSYTRSFAQIFRVLLATG